MPDYLRLTETVCNAEIIVHQRMDSLLLTSQTHTACVHTADTCKCTISIYLELFTIGRTSGKSESTYWPPGVNPSSVFVCGEAIAIAELLVVSAVAVSVRKIPSGETAVQRTCKKQKTA